MRSLNLIQKQHNQVDILRMRNSVTLYSRAKKKINVNRQVNLQKKPNISNCFEAFIA